MTKPIILSTPYQHIHISPRVITKPKRYNFTEKRMKDMTLAKFIYHGGYNHEAEPSFFQCIIWYVHLKYYRYNNIDNKVWGEPSIRDLVKWAWEKERK